MAKETKFCSNCGAEIGRDAEICSKCGVRVKTPTAGVKSPRLAAGLSFFCVGLGQIYNGQIDKAIVLMITWIISCGLYIFSCGGLYVTSCGLYFDLIRSILLPILWIYGIYDAYTTATKINAGEITV